MPSFSSKWILLAPLSVILLGLLGESAWGQCFCRKPKACCQCCPDGVPVAPSPDGLSDLTPDSLAEPVPLDDAQLPSSRFAALASDSVVLPNMIGDFFGGNTRYNVFGSGTSPSLGSGTLAISGGDRRFKFAENTSPFPTDRVFFNYHHFQRPISDANGVVGNVDRFVFGLEKTFFNDLMSIETRIPIVHGLDAQQTLNLNGPSGASNRATEFGNIVLSLKGLLWRDQCSALSAGLSMTLPTAQDTTVHTSTGQLAILAKNESVHLQPFLGYYRKVSDRAFFQLFTQLDFDVNGNDIYVGDARDFAGTYRDQSLLMMDLTVGYWLYRNSCARYVTAVAPVIELHYNTMMTDTDVVDGRDVGDSQFSGVISNPYNRMDVLNLTAGVHLELGCLSNLTLGAVVPLRDEEERLFDTEIVLQFNRRF